MLLRFIANLPTVSLVRDAKPATRVHDFHRTLRSACPASTQFHSGKEIAMWSRTLARPPTGRAAQPTYFGGRTNWCLPLSPATACGHRSLTTQNGTTLQGDKHLNFVCVGRITAGQSALRELIRHGIVMRWLVALANTRNAVSGSGRVPAATSAEKKSVRLRPPKYIEGSTFCNVSVLLSAVEFPSAPEHLVRDRKATTGCFRAG